MFPHVVTVFNIKETKDELLIHRCVVKDVFCYDEQIISPEGKGEKVSSIYTVVFSAEALKKYVEKIGQNSPENVFSLKNNDLIVFGEYGKINNVNDVIKSETKHFLIKSISDNRYGEEELQNIKVSG